MAMKRKRDASWSELGIDPLESVLRKLPSFLDVLRFKRVCRSWYSIAERYVASPCFSPCSQTPWLLLPSDKEDWDDDEEERGLCFFNLDEKKEYTDVSVCGEVYEGRCVGSSRGWLILLDKTANLNVFNPFSGSRIQVGSLKEDLKFSNVDAYAVQEEPRAFVPKAVVMSDIKKKNKNKDGVVLIYGSRKKLAFCRFRDGRFIELDGAHQPYQDIICHANYMVSAVSETGSVEAWDFSGEFPTKIMDTTPSFPLKTAEFGRSFRDLYSSHFYLVESRGELLFIVRLIGEFVDGDGKPVREVDLLNDEDTQPDICPYRTLLFHVYKLDRHEKKWVEMESLGDDEVVFIGGNESMSLQVEDCPGCEKDSIYFTDSYWERVDEDYSYGGHDMGYYSLRDRSVKPFYDTQLWKMKPTPFWVVPDPW